MKNSAMNKFKYIAKIILLIMGTVLLINAVIMLFIANYNSGILFTGIMAVVLFICGIFFDALYKIKWLKYSIIIAFILLLCLLSFIMLYGQTDNVTYSEDAVIVLGSGIDGEQITTQLAYRLDKAVEYYNINPDVVIVVSGGQGLQETIPEALAMERYLISRGIPKDRILKEEKSISTYTNLINSKTILDRHFNRDYKVTLITSDYHVYRAVKFAKATGLDCTHYHAKIEWYSIPMRYLRECVAVVRLWIVGVS